jgi:hypothetical protein
VQALERSRAAWLRSVSRVIRIRRRTRGAQS